MQCTTLDTCGAAFGVARPPARPPRKRRRVVAASMELRQLGSSDLRVSSLCLGAGRRRCRAAAATRRLLPLPSHHCLPPTHIHCCTRSTQVCSLPAHLAAPAGTMLFGESTPPAEAERLLGLAADAGVNCFDTAEMYPVPQAAATQARQGCLRLDGLALLPAAACWALAWCARLPHSCSPARSHAPDAARCRAGRRRCWGRGCGGSACARAATWWLPPRCRGRAAWGGCAAGRRAWMAPTSPPRWMPACGG